MLKEGTPNISVAVDIYGDIYGYREAAFLDRPGSKRYILGRIDEENKLDKIINSALKINKDFSQKESDLDYLDAWDHIVLRTLDQAKKDKSFGVPFELGPVKSRVYSADKKQLTFKHIFLILAHNEKKLLIIGGNSSVSKSFQKLFNKNYLIYLNLFIKKIQKKNCFFLDLNNDVLTILEFVKHIKKHKI